MINSAAAQFILTKLKKVTGLARPNYCELSSFTCLRREGAMAKHIFILSDP